jgi:hypothetical protein
VVLLEITTLLPSLTTAMAQLSICKRSVILKKISDSDELLLAPKSVMDFCQWSGECANDTHNVAENGGYHWQIQAMNIDPQQSGRDTF